MITLLLLFFIVHSFLKFTVCQKYFEYKNDILYYDIFNDVSQKIISKFANFVN